MQEPLAAYWIMLVGGIMPYALVMIAKANPDYDNADPRNAAALKTPLRKGAYGAHLNSLEAFPLFAAAVLLAGLRHAPAQAVNLAAYVWLACRLAYAACYLTHKASLRSLSWLGGFLASLAILVLALTRAAGA